MNQLLLAVPLLACPIGMGLMIWFMTRSRRKQGNSASDGTGEVARPLAERFRVRHERAAQATAPAPGPAGLRHA